MTVTRSKMLKGAGWVSAASIAVNSLGIVSTIILARLLAPEDFGLVAIATALAMIISEVSEFSLSKALIQHTEPTEAHYHTAWTMNVVRGLILGGAIAALGQPLARFYNEPPLSEILLALGCITVIGGSINPKLVVFARELSFSQSFIVRTTSKVAGFCAAISVAWIYESYWALIVGTLATETAIVIASYALIPFVPKPTFSKYRDLLSFSIWLTLGKWVQAVNWRSQPLLYGYLLPASLVGQHSLANKLVSTTLEQAVSPIKQLLFPTFSRLKDDEERLRNGYMRSQGVLCLITFPLAAGFTVLAEGVVMVAIGEEWLPAVPLMQLFAISHIIRSTQNVGSIGMATANTKRLFYRDVQSFFVRWPLVILGLYLGYQIGSGDPYLTLIGGMIGQVGAVTINTVINMNLIAKITTITLADHAAIIWRTLVSVLVMGAVVYLANTGSPDVTGSLGELVRLLTLVALGAFVYFLSLYGLWVIGGKQSTAEHECVGIIQALFSKAFGKPTPREG